MKVWKQIRKWKVPMLATVMVFLIMRFVFLFGYVPTESMEPTLEKGSYILGVRIYSELEAGDVIVFRHEGRLLVKRIAVVGGEMVERDGICMAVPEGCYYVLGDNAGNSYDSRYWEEPFVREEDVVAKIVL